MNPPNVLNASATPSDLASAALTRLVGVLGEDAIFALAAGGDAADALETLAKRRQDTYAQVVQGLAAPRMTDGYDVWLASIARALAPVAPPVWIPMMEVVREKVTLEVGARGLRSLFSSKPSEKDVARVTKIGTLTVRVMRAVLAADGALDAEEKTLIAALIASIGFPDADAIALRDEAPIPVEKLDIYGDLDPGVARAIVRGAWLAAALDMIDPREEQVVRVAGYKLGVANDQVEAMRAEAQNRVDSRRISGLAAVDGIRFVLADRQPGIGVHLAALTGQMMLPRRYRDEALAQVGHGAPVVLGRRYEALADSERVAVLGIAWAAALCENPAIARRALLAARWERFAEDIGGDAAGARDLVESWLRDVLMTFSRTMK